MLKEANSLSENPKLEIKEIELSMKTPFKTDIKEREVENKQGVYQEMGRALFEHSVTV